MLCDLPVGDAKLKKYKCTGHDFTLTYKHVGIAVVNGICRVVDTQHQLEI